MTVNVHGSIAAILEALLGSWRAGAPVVLVPTMGALHAGHEALIHRAAQLAGPAARIVVSIFVNPLQFGVGEDFARYPRDLQRDIDIAAAAGATDIFAPAPGEFTPQDMAVAVDPGPMADVLCGPFRPGHFRGVCTIVLKLFHVVQPTHALFGWKDAQQFIILRKMVRDLDLPIEMVGVETVREPDGLAMSSRNAYLSPEERRRAPALQRTLLELKEALLCGAIAAPDAEAFARERLAAAGISNVDYVQVVSADDLGPPRADGTNLVAGAIRLGSTRLIDNVK
jgi:pantoate--beta-alanine ligase